MINFYLPPRRSLLASLVLFLTVGGVAAQSPDTVTAYARRVLGVLCSPDLDGRGYVNKGEQRAADWLVQEYKAIGLEPVNAGSYLQPFDLEANAFPDKVELTINNRSLKPGLDFLVHPDAPTIKGKFKTYQLSFKEWQMPLEDLKNRAQNCVLVIKSEWIESRNPMDREKIREKLEILKQNPPSWVKGVIVLQSGKLVWFPSKLQAKTPLFLVKKDKLEADTLITKVKMNVVAELKKRTSNNVLGMVRGQAQPDSFIVICGHYDHLGRMGKKAYFPGANDNASGIAMLLNLAKYYKRNPHRYSVVFVCFGSEEIGLVGSQHLVTNPIFPIKSIAFLLNLDILGTGIDGIQVVNGSVYKTLFERLKAINTEKKLIKEVKTRGEACISDHCFFHQLGVPSFYSYTLGGIGEYHNTIDKAETLTLEAFKPIYLLFSEFIAGIGR